jgi:two-component system chemotaxis response regulator CheB
MPRSACARSRSGAADYIPKPKSNRELTNSAAFRRDLIEKIRALGTRRRQRLSSARPAAGRSRHSARAGSR